MADKICYDLGLEPLFNIKSHPMPWISEFELNAEKNFFESRVQEYRTGSALSWD
jgi:ribonucleoside-diphosphate reductase beta chain